MNKKYIRKTKNASMKYIIYTSQDLINHANSYSA